MKKLIEYFAERSLISNVILVGVIASALLFWGKLGKEEMPDFAMDWLRITLPYPGAPAEDVEFLVTRPIEEQLREVSGIEELSSTSSFGNSSFRITIDSKNFDSREVVQEVKDALDRADLTADVEEPRFRRFSSAEKAIIDIAFYHTGHKMLDTEARYELQKYALAFETQLLARPEISSLDKRGYLQPELQIVVDPDKLKRYDMSLNEVRSQIRAHHVRFPVGRMEDRQESEITVLSELEDVESLSNLVIRGGFEGQRILLKQVATIRRGFAKNTSITKAQGHEAIIFNVKKSASTDILKAQQAVTGFVDSFKENYPDAPVDMVLIDDESFDVRNRLSLIGFNGLVGFLLIVIVLFVFLDFKSGVWVAMGIPFTLGFTLLAALFIGYTVNNMTLAAIIIVLGIVVDDAIIVAENISRLVSKGMPLRQAVVEGTHQVMNPVIASILTTCAAFVPLMFFSGRFGLFVKYIPWVVFFMLAASLFESAFILPAHLRQPMPGEKYFRRFSATMTNSTGGHWVFRVEAVYAKILAKVLRFRFLVILGFVGLLAASLYLYHSQMKFVMFPREEAKEISIRVTAPEKTTRQEMARLTEELEKMFLQDKDNVMSVLTSIAQNRRGGEVKENEASLRAELVPPDERSEPLARLIERWEKQTASMSQFEEVRFMRQRFGSDSGSPLELEVQENNDAVRKRFADRLAEMMQKDPVLANVEIERPLVRNEYAFHLKQPELIRLGIDPVQLASTLRAFVEGQILYTLNKGDEEIDVRLISESDQKKEIDQILNLNAANQSSYLVPFHQLIDLKQGDKPANIQRINYKRTTKLFADIKEGADTSPLEIAERYETEVFPRILQEFPTSLVLFRGEVEDSRESQSDFLLSTVAALAMIYILLVFLYNSLWTPLVIGAVIPFGAVGVVLSFMAHDMSRFGFFAVIGTLGMIGVVVNDAIVMVSKLEDENPASTATDGFLAAVAQISSTRFRPVIVTTLTTVAGLFPTAYGWAGYDSMLAEMMLAMGWGLLFGTAVTLLFVPCVYSYFAQIRGWMRKKVVS